MRITVLLAVLVLFLSSRSFPQQFVLEWKAPGYLIFQGDMDGDGPGEFAVKSLSNQLDIYDASTHVIKYSFPLEPSIFGLFGVTWNYAGLDFNGDGVNEVVIYSGPSARIVDPLTGTILFRHDASSGYPQIGQIRDVDNDGIDELEVFADDTS